MVSKLGFIPIILVRLVVAIFLFTYIVFISPLSKLLAEKFLKCVQVSLKPWFHVKIKLF